MKDRYGRRGRRDYEELDRLFKEADRFLEDEDLRGANDVLKKAGVKAAWMWGGAGQPALPGHTRRLIGLLWEVQEDLHRSGLSSSGALQRDLRELRSRFRLEARRDARETGEEREQMKNKAIRYRFRRAINGEDSQGMNDIAIPDYVMRDFGVPETATTELRYRTLRASDIGEDSTQAHE